jgi:hypothetical protein
MLRLAVLDILEVSTLEEKIKLLEELEQTQEELRSEIRSCKHSEDQLKSELDRKRLALTMAESERTVLHGRIGTLSGEASDRESKQDFYMLDEGVELFSGVHVVADPPLEACLCALRTIRGVIPRHFHTVALASKLNACYYPEAFRICYLARFSL